MSNPFLTTDHSEIETAILLENAVHCDLSTISESYAKAVAFTDGKKVFINSEDNLAKILPAYDRGMLKWILWHEEYHKKLSHHNRFFKYLKELSAEDTEREFQLTKEEVNIIMDILVHDSLSRMFPELIETAIANLAQMRNRNSLKYTFKTFTLEEMLDEYKKEKKEPPKPPKGPEGPEGPEGPKGPGGGTSKKKPKDDDKDKDKSKEPPETPSDDKGHGKGGSGDDDKDSPKEDKEPEIKDGGEPPEPEHDKTDWSKLEDIDSKEFIDDGESRYIQEKVEKLRKKKFKLGQLTQKLNSLATTTRERTYAMPSYMRPGPGIIMKGRKPGKTALYLCFDASGSMGAELETFKEIISKSIPHAMDCPCEWFTYSYGKGKFKDIMKVHATSGFNDDGDRTIELCWKAEQAGYSPIGVTDGGGQISWSKKYLKELKRTVLVGQNESWLKKAKEINPHIQIIDI